MKNFEIITSVANFLVAQEGSVLATYRGKMSAADQRALFGRYFGKGTIIIDGKQETVCNRVKVCFGLDYDDRKVTKWIDL